MNKKVVIGQVKAAHGLKGQFKIQTYTEEPNNIFSYGFVYIGDQYQRVVLNKHKSIKNEFLVSCEEIKSRTDVDKIIKNNIYIFSDQLPKVNTKDNIYYHDLMNLSVIDENSKIIGKVISVSNYGSSDIVEIDLKQKKESLLIPFNKNCIDTIDAENNFLKVKNIKGYME
jgi:16S rRNA processing protein RimM|tara:strand:- start:3300 stop:3809 length:510 start_codon:yes stop_codon:yes gene_type:complete